MKKITRFVLPFVVAFLALALVMGISRPRLVEADAVTTYFVSTFSDGATAYTTSGGSTSGVDVAGYGSAVVHVIADASATTSTLTVYPQYSNEIVNCTIASNWFTGTDYLEYTVADRISQTDQNSTTAPISVTYTYASATGGHIAVTQSISTTGDRIEGREFKIYGRCMRLKYAVSYGTITPTVYVMRRDIQ